MRHTLHGCDHTTLGSSFGQDVIASSLLLFVSPLSVAHTPYPLPLTCVLCVVWCVLRVACCGLLCYVLVCIVVRLKVDIALRCCRGLPMDIFRSAIPMRWMLWSRRLLLKLFMHIHSWIGMWLTYNDGRYLTHALAHPFDTCPPREDP